ncbi:hypothetical protein J1G35_10835 [Pseudomonas sp. SH10-3B]|uniref:hypothetical protein n=1 Tax=Pseudomonas sp. SH10-3B TaxID=2816049 RepID=UPI001CA64A09|nr:hypothetical protein [Pseudomonas sp. SH10-3B]MBY8946362.1 hypothetical protein [Pseudomonas sp. SH10-3B]
MPLQSNVDKANTLRAHAIGKNANMRKKRNLRTKIHVALYGTKLPYEEVKDYCAPKTVRIEDCHIGRLNLLIEYIEQSDEADLSQAADYWKMHPY